MEASEWRLLVLPVSGWVLRLPPTVPKNVHVRQSGNSTLAAESACEREWLFIFPCGPAISRRLVQGVSRQLGLAAAAGGTVAEKWTAG